MNFKFLLTLVVSACASFAFSSCQMMEPEERPIRPTSENSDLAHGHSSPTGQASGLGAISNQSLR